VMTATNRANANILSVRIGSKELVNEGDSDESLVSACAVSTQIYSHYVRLIKCTANI
jgi:hypothetical protein